MTIHGADPVTGLISPERVPLVRWLRPIERVKNTAPAVAAALGFDDGLPSHLAVKEWFWKRRRGASPIEAWRAAKRVGALVTARLEAERAARRAEVAS